MTTRMLNRTNRAAMVAYRLGGWHALMEYCAQVWPKRVRVTCLGCNGYGKVVNYADTVGRKRRQLTCFTCGGRKEVGTRDAKTALHWWKLGRQILAAEASPGDEAEKPAPDQADEEHARPEREEQERP